MKLEYQKPEASKINVDDLWKIMSKSTIQQLGEALSNDSFLKFREVSEVYNMWLLEKAVDIFESFYGSEWKKTLWECVKENWVEDFHHVLNVCSWQALIRLLSECEDEYLEWILSKDIEWFGDNYIKLLQPKRENISTKLIIEEIRDWISHRRYTVWNDWIYIFNPKGLNHKRDFVASIWWELFTDIHTIRKFTQIFRWWEFKDDDSVFIDDDNNDYSVNDEESSLSLEELAEIFPPMSEDDYNRVIEKSLEDFETKDGEWNNSNKSSYDGGFTEKIWKVKIKWYKIQRKNGVKLSDLQRNNTSFSVEGEDMLLSDDQSKLLGDYFKKHHFDWDGFRFAFWHLENGRPHIIDHLFMNRIINRINMGEVYKDLQDYSWGINNENYDKNFDFFSFISGFWDVTWDSMLYSDDSNYTESVLLPWTLVSSRLFSHCYELVPTYLKMLYIINSYLNDDSVTMGLWENMDETTHIRNTLAHGHYSLLPWVKDVLLYDPICNYHWKFDIDKMYEERKEYERKRKARLIN